MQAETPDADIVGRWLTENLGLGAEARHDILVTAVIIAGLWLLRRLTLRVVDRRSDDVRVRYRWKKMSAYLSVAFGTLLVGGVWIEGFESLATYLGLLSAGLAIALKDLVVNFAGWTFILWRRPFEVGDRIQIGEYKGDVIDLRIFQFTLMEIGNWVDADQSTGRVIHVPNGQVFSRALANFTKGFRYIWNEIPVLVTFESDWRKAKEILDRVARQHAEHLGTAAQEELRKAASKFLIFYSKLTPIVYTSVVDSGVLLTIRYLTEPRRRRGTAQAIWEDILDEFARCPDIDFAYPTQRFYDNSSEGKPGAAPGYGEGG